MPKKKTETLVFLDNKTFVKQKQIKRRRNWAFTHWEEQDWEDIYQNEDNLRYLCVGKETCPKTGKIHFQGWLQTERQASMKQVKDILRSKKVHLEAYRGNEQQNDVYCKKENNFVTFGEFKKQGQRTDLQEFYNDVIKKGASKLDIMEKDFSLYCRYRGGIIDAINENNNQTAPTWRDVTVDVYSGKTGTGKTRKATEENIDAFKIQGDQLDWFDGYNGEKTLIIDEYANDIKITKLLGLLDGYKLRLPIKGSFTYARWTKVIITTNLSKDDLHYHAFQNHREALFRRINNFLVFE